MNEDTYIDTQQQILLLAELLRALPLAEFVRAVHRAESVGPIFNPTLYSQGSPRLRQIGGIAGILLLAQSKINPIIEEMERQNDLKHSA